MFKYIDNRDRTFLFGAYRGEKSHLEWILGENPQRYEKLYNIRFNQDLFSQRRGGVIADSLPDYILIYNTQNPQNEYHLFPCVNSSIKNQSDMKNCLIPVQMELMSCFLWGKNFFQNHLTYKNLFSNNFLWTKQESHLLLKY